MPTSKSFEKHYRKLNSEQKKAVDVIEGPVMVIAGHGPKTVFGLQLRGSDINLTRPFDFHNLRAILALSSLSSFLYLIGAIFV